MRLDVGTALMLSGLLACVTAPHYHQRHRKFGDVLDYPLSPTEDGPCPSQCHVLDQVMVCNHASGLSMLRVAKCVNAVKSIAVVEFRSSLDMCACSLLDYVRLTTFRRVLTFTQQPCGQKLLDKCGPMLPDPVLLLSQTGLVAGLLMQQDDSGWRKATRQHLLWVWNKVSSLSLPAAKRRYRIKVLRTVKGVYWAQSKLKTGHKDHIVPFMLFMGGHMGPLYGSSYRGWYPAQAQEPQLTETEVHGTGWLPITEYMHLFKEKAEKKEPELTEKEVETMLKEPGKEKLEPTAAEEKGNEKATKKPEVVVEVTEKPSEETMKIEMPKLGGKEEIPPTEEAQPPTTVPTETKEEAEPKQVIKVHEEPNKEEIEIDIPKQKEETVKEEEPQPTTVAPEEEQEKETTSLKGEEPETAKEETTPKEEETQLPTTEEQIEAPLPEAIPEQPIPEQPETEGGMHKFLDNRRLTLVLALVCLAVSITIIAIVVQMCRGGPPFDRGGKDGSKRGGADGSLKNIPKEEVQRRMSQPYSKWTQEDFQLARDLEDQNKTTGGVDQPVPPEKQVEYDIKTKGQPTTSGSAKTQGDDKTGSSWTQANVFDIVDEISQAKDKKVVKFGGETVAEAAKVEPAAEADGANAEEARQRRASIANRRGTMYVKPSDARLEDEPEEQTPASSTQSSQASPATAPGAAAPGKPAAPSAAAPEAKETGKDIFDTALEDHHKVEREKAKAEAEAKEKEKTEEAKTEDKKSEEKKGDDEKSDTEAEKKSEKKKKKKRKKKAGSDTVEKGKEGEGEDKVKKKKKKKKKKLESDDGEKHGESPEKTESEAGSDKKEEKHKKKKGKKKKKKGEEGEEKDKEEKDKKEGDDKKKKKKESDDGEKHGESPEKTESEAGSDKKEEKHKKKKGKKKKKKGEEGEEKDKEEKDKKEGDDKKKGNEKEKEGKDADSKKIGTGDEKAEDDKGKGKKKKRKKEKAEEDKEEKEDSDTHKKKKKKKKKKGSEDEKEQKEGDPDKKKKKGKEKGTDSQATEGKEGEKKKSKKEKKGEGKEDDDHDKKKGKHSSKDKKDAEGEQDASGEKKKKKKSGTKGHGHEGDKKGAHRKKRSKSKKHSRKHEGDKRGAHHKKRSKSKRQSRSKRPHLNRSGSASSRNNSSSRRSSPECFRITHEQENDMSISMQLFPQWPNDDQAEFPSTRSALCRPSRSPGPAKHRRDSSSEEDSLPLAENEQSGFSNQDTVQRDSLVAPGGFVSRHFSRAHHPSTTDFSSVFRTLNMRKRSSRPKNPDPGDHSSATRHGERDQGSVSQPDYPTLHFPNRNVSDLRSNFYAGGEPQKPTIGRPFQSFPVPDPYLKTTRQPKESVHSFESFPKHNCWLGFNTQGDTQSVRENFTHICLGLHSGTSSEENHNTAEEKDEKVNHKQLHSREVSKLSHPKEKEPSTYVQAISSRGFIPTSSYRPNISTRKCPPESNCGVHGARMVKPSPSTADTKAIHSQKSTMSKIPEPMAELLHNKKDEGSSQPPHCSSFILLKPVPKPKPRGRNTAFVSGKEMDRSTNQRQEEKLPSWEQTQMHPVASFDINENSGTLNFKNSNNSSTEATCKTSSTSKLEDFIRKLQRTSPNHFIGVSSHIVQ